MFRLGGLGTFLIGRQPSGVLFRLGRMASAETSLERSHGPSGPDRPIEGRTERI